MDCRTTIFEQNEITYNTHTPMKKTFLLLGILFIAFGCAKDENAAVKSDFQKYVNENFDNPKDLESIISISQCEAVVFDAMLMDAKHYMTDYKQTEEHLDSIHEALFNRVQDIIENNYRVTRFIQTHQDYSCVRTLLGNLSADVNIKMDKITKGTTAYERLEKELNDSTVQYNIFTKQLVKYRVQKDNDMKIDSIFYVTCNNGAPYFRKKDIKASDFGGNAIVIVDLVANDLMNDYRILVERSRLLSEAESALDVIMELAE